MNRTSFGALAKRYRLALSLCGIVAACAVILPACGGGGDDALFTIDATTMTVVVTSVPATGIVPAGGTRQYAIEVRDGSNVILPDLTTATWSIVGASGIATITPAGGLATCITLGTVTVHAVGPVGTSGANLTGDASLQCDAPVLNPTTMTMLVTSTPTTGIVQAGATRQYAIEVRDQLNGVLPAFTTAVWSIVGTAGVATIGSAGLATCIAAGTVTVHAVGPVGPTGANLTADTSLQCAAPIPVATTMTILVTSAPTTGTIPVGATRQYAIEVRDQYNAVMTAFTTAAWSIVGTTGIAVINPGGGLATCVAPGTVTVHAIGPVGSTGANLTADTSLQCIATSGNPATVIVLGTTTVTAPVDGTATTTVIFRDAGGQPTTNGCPIGFTILESAAAPGVATVTSNGLTATVTGRVAGTTTLRAACTGGPIMPSAFTARVQVTTPPLNIAKIVIATPFVYFPSSSTSSSFRFVGTALDANGGAVPSAVIVTTVAVGAGVAGIVTVDQTGNVTVAPTAGGAAGPALSGGAMITMTSGGQREVAFLTYGANAGTIRGHITSTLGQFVGGFTARGTGPAGAGGPGPAISAGPVTNDGFFYFAGLNPGNYVVEIVNEVGVIIGTSASVTVTAGQITDLPTTLIALRSKN